MTGTRRRTRPAAVLLALALVVSACDAAAPEPTPVPTSVPTAAPAASLGVADAYLDAWAAGEYGAMYALLAPADREATTEERFTALHRGLRDFLAASEIKVQTSDPQPAAYGAEPRAADQPAPTPTPVPSPSPGETSEPPASDPPSSAPPPDAVLDGPMPAMLVPAELDFSSERFEDVRLERDIVMTQGPNGWQVRWSPTSLFPELGSDGQLQLDKSVPRRGDIVGSDGTVWATTDEQGRRVYPQEWLAGQTIGYVSGVTAEDLVELGSAEYAADEAIGRSGLEAGAEELLRGRAGYVLSAVPAGGAPVPLFSRDAVPGANLAITLRPGIQATAQNALGSYPDAATAVLDPTSGDVWALASSPAFNPNAMTIGTTLDGTPLAPASSDQILNKAAAAAYPAGSSFKTFTLAAALRAGVAGRGTLVSCPPTWTYAGFEFVNYEKHSLPGLVGLPEAMAFSCNTTYMPLSLDIMAADPTGLTDTVHEFGFGAPTGIGYIAETAGVVPDAEFFETTPRWDGQIIPYNDFDQIQLSIGQGSFLGSPLQVANAYAAVGNGGTLWQARLVSAATLPDGEVVEAIDQTPLRQVSLSADELAFITEALRAVVTLPYGTGTAAFAGFGIPVAGKSGTAETGGPDPDSWFPAYAPAFDPSIAVATVLVRVPLSTGGADAAPLVRQVMAAHFGS
jgi:penicillin-binding protein 2